MYILEKSTIASILLVVYKPLIECKTKQIFAPIALSKIKPTFAILLVDVGSIFVANHRHVFKPPNINKFKQKNMSQDSVSLRD